MKFTANAIRDIFKRPSRDSEISEMLQQLVSEINQSAFDQDQSKNNDLIFILTATIHILVKEFNYTRILPAYNKIVKQISELDDIHNWLPAPGFAGHFHTYAAANSHGCGHYTINCKQKPILDLSNIYKPLGINELNTRYQRLHYAASLAIGQKKKIKVIELGGGSGSYYILLRRLFPNVHFNYTCIDYDESCPLNVDEINNDFHHVPTIQQCKEPESCDLFIGSGVLQYIQNDAFDPVSRAIGSSRIALIDRTAFMKRDSFWTIQTRTDSRHAFRVFNEEELSDIATSNKSRTILAEGICPEDWFKIFNMEDFTRTEVVLFKWYITCKRVGNASPENLDFNDFVIH